MPFVVVRPSPIPQLWVLGSDEIMSITMSKADEKMSSKEFVDYYDLLMVSPQADRAMIEWAVRLLAARFGKKNGRYVDEERYNEVREAYRTLVDPQKREAYDKLRVQKIGAGGSAGANGSPIPAAAAQLPAPAVKLAPGARRNADDIRTVLTATVDDVVVERRKRQGVMSALYDIMVRRPRNPELGRAEIARSAGVSNDELEATLWYLRERELLKTTNQGLYAITSVGVDWVESGGLPHLCPENQAPSAEEIDLPGGDSAAVPKPQPIPQAV